MMVQIWYTAWLKVRENNNLYCRIDLDGIKVHGESSVVLHEVNVNGHPQFGLSVCGDSKLGVSTVSATRCVFSQNGEGGVHLRGSSLPE